VTGARSADPLTAATTSVLMPSLRTLGFRRKSNRLIARVRADILQFFDLQLPSFGGKRFCVNYASLPLFPPRDCFVLAYGDRLRGVTGGELWFEASTHDLADEAMGSVAALAQALAVPFFEATASVEGLLAHISGSGLAKQHHGILDRACCMARLGHFTEAHALALQAILRYREDGRPFCAAYIELCDQLIACLAEETAGELLCRWVEYSVGELRLEKLFQESSRTCEST
jgi:hypothetical protein